MLFSKNRNPVAVPTILIVGGSSGVGLEIARQLNGGTALTNGIPSAVDVHITGRKDPNEHTVTFHELTITTDTNELARDLNETLGSIDYIDLLIYCVGFAEDDLIEDLDDEHITLMCTINLMVPQMLLARTLRNQRELRGFIALSSITQNVPRKKEPTYCSGKAGLRMFTEAAAKNDRIHQSLLVAPAGIKTPFWRNQPNKDTKQFLDASIVAKDTIDAFISQTTKYKEILIKRSPYQLIQIKPSLQTA